MLKVIVAGGRHFSDYELLKSKLLFFFQNYDLKDIEIVSGTAKGADTLGERFAREFGCGIKRFVPDWDTYGNGAGYRRNAEMGNYADACVCFWDGESRGTMHMINIAKKKGMKLKVVRYQG